MSSQRLARLAGLAVGILGALPTVGAASTLRDWQSDTPVQLVQDLLDMR
ncbi:MAG TPA: hypothetical protein VGA58_12260 [bacterium]